MDGELFLARRMVCFGDGRVLNGCGMRMFAEGTSCWISLTTSSAVDKVRAASHNSDGL